MRWLVSGTNQQTGQSTQIKVEAETMKEAFADARMRGVDPSQAMKIGESSRPKAATAVAERPPTAPMAVDRPAAGRVHAAQTETAKHHATFGVAILFIVAGTFSLIRAVLARMSASSVQTTRSDYTADLGAVSRAAAYSLQGEYLAVIGGACIAIGFLLIMLRQIAINTSRPA
jgi:hypothetical protein